MTSALLHRFRRVLACLVCIVAMPSLAAPVWEPDADDPLQQKAAAAIERLLSKHADAQKYLDESYAFAVYPGAVRAGLFVAGGYGNGLIVKEGKLAAHSKLWQLTYAIFAGGQYYSQFLFFRDKAAFDFFINDRLQFTGQAAIAFLHLGAAADPAFHPDIALVTQTRFGLEIELTPGTVYFTYRPVDASATSAP
jgi:lipid-binding SYLF domain-containing protein